ncbi:tRNA (adenosine(37)-N6)-threonylcarbamoyltransferase complex ATPase subunit type 1 TsaE [Phormidesmis sp. 146-33]
MSQDFVTSQVIFLADAESTRRLGVQLGQRLSAGDVLLLEGDLGSGKTTLVQGIGEGLGVDEAIDSPTFTLVNEYLSGRVPLYHLDLYRLNSVEAAEMCPEIYWEGVEVKPGIVAIEWSERLPYQPDHYLQISLAHDPQSGRQAQLRAIDSRGTAIAGEWAKLLNL